MKSQKKNASTSQTTMKAGAAQKGMESKTGKTATKAAASSQASSRKS